MSTELWAALAVVAAWGGFAGMGWFIAARVSQGITFAILVQWSRRQTANLSSSAWGTANLMMRRWEAENGRKIKKGNKITVVTEDYEITVEKR